MRVLLQRVSQANVTVEEKVVGSIGAGLLLFLGVGQKDDVTQVKILADKVVHLRIFADEEGKMNRSLLESKGEVLLISQFTLYADMKRGRRPSFINAAPPALAETLYEQFKDALASHGITVASGIFGASMRISLQNEGPVTIWLDTDDL